MMTSKAAEKNEEESIVTATEALSVGSPIHHASPIAASSTTTTATTTTTTATTAQKQSPTHSQQQPQQQQQLTALDYVGTKKSVMQLFSLPYSDKSVSVGIHNVEGCLMIDADPMLHETLQHSSASGADLLSSTTVERENNANTRISKDEEKSFERQKKATTAKSLDAAETLEESGRSVVALQQQSVAALAAISTMMEEGRDHSSNHHHAQSLLFAANNATARFHKDGEKTDTNIHAEAALVESPATEPREYVPWDFQGMKLLVGSDALVYRNAKNDSSLTVRVEDVESMREQLKHHHSLQATARQGSTTERKELSQQQHPGKRTYSEALKTRQLIAKQENDDSVISSVACQPSTNTISSSMPSLEFDGVHLHTSIVPTTNLSLGGNFSLVPEPPSDSDKLSSPIYTIIDAYLDQLITNVPQLALVLREKGFVSSVKLMQTQQIPEAFLQEMTFDTSHPFEVVSTSSDPGGKQSPGSNAAVENIFDPNIMQMNASSLLTFLRANCTKDNATYLLHREAGQQNIQLFDVSAISSQRQQKWIWWLAMMSYRFSQRLRHLSMQMTMNGSVVDPALQRSFRARERSLLQNTLSLFEEFIDMGGKPHEILVAEVCEKLAETFLRAEMDGATTARPASNKENSAPNQSPIPATSTPTLQQRYNKARPDALNKAQDYLVKGISALWKEWERVVDELSISSSMRKTSRRRRRNQQLQTKDSSSGINRVESISEDSSSSDDDDAESNDEENEAIQVKAETLASLLTSLHHKIIDISLRLAELYLKDYWSSSAMQALRTAARKLADAVRICLVFPKTRQTRVLSWMHVSQLQYTRLWDLCGHFARSFAADDLWRERGHAAGDDVISVLRDVESVFPWETPKGTQTVGPSTCGIFFPFIQDLPKPPGDLFQLTGLADAGTGLIEDSMESATKLLDAKHQLQRDRRRVLVAACFAYSRATHAYEASFRFQNWYHKVTLGLEEKQPLTEELAPLNLLRQRQGDANNELAKLLLNEVRELLAASQGTASLVEMTRESASAAEPLLSSALFWFKRGLQSFDACNDLRNSTLLRCNICQCYKIKANAHFAKSSGAQGKTAPSPVDKAKHADTCLGEAISHLQAAHEIMRERDVDPMRWDMVSNELAATFLVLGVRRRQALIGGGNTPVVLQAMRLTPGETKSIIDPMEKALNIYDQSGNAQQASSVHYQLALFYSKIWTCQRDETKTRETLSAAFRHYNTALAYFSRSIQGNEQTFVLLCLDLSNLYSTVSGEECLRQAFLRCLDTRDAFSQASVDLARPSQDDWMTTMSTLAASVEDRLFKTLRSLVKLEDAKTGSTKYKDSYRTALTAKMTASNSCGTGTDKGIVAMHMILQAVHEKYSAST